MALYAAEHLSSEELTGLQAAIDAFVSALAATATVHALSVYEGRLGNPAHSLWHATIIWSRRTPIRPDAPAVPGPLR